MTKQYDERDAFDMDQGGGYYMRHVKAMTPEQLESKSDIDVELAWRDMQIDELQQKLDAMAAESDTNLRSAASELNTSWMLHKTMMGAQAALLCLSQGDILSAKEWLEGTTDEAIIEMPDDLNPSDLQTWFDSNMVSNGGSNGFLTHSEALELLRKRAPATDSYLNSVRADAIESVVDALASSGALTVGDSIVEVVKLAEKLRAGTHDTADKAGAK